MHSSVAATAEMGALPTLGIVGDIMLARGVGHRASQGAAAILAAEAASVLDGCDVRCGNLESPIAEVAERAHGSAFKAPAVSVNMLQHFDVLSLANNHIFDCGDNGIDETLKLLEANRIRHLGVGVSEKSAYSPVVIKRGATTFAFLGCTAKQHLCVPLGSKYHVALLDSPQMYDAVFAASKQAEVTVLLFHGGNEYIEYPPPSQRRALRRLCQAGANIIASSHPHVLGGYEQVDANHLIWHSLGDFIFDSDLPARRKGGILLVRPALGHIQSFELVPTYIGDDFVVQRATGRLAEEIGKRVAVVSQALLGQDYDTTYSRRYLFTMSSFQAKRLIHLWRKVGPLAATGFAASRSLLVWHYLRKLIRDGHQ